MLSVASRLRAIALPLLTACALASCDAFERSPEFEVRAYDGPAITPDAATGWTATVADGVLALRGDVREIHGSRRDEVVFLETTAAAEGLPRLLEMWVGVPNGPGEVMRHVELEIQDWSVPGVVSGRVKAWRDSPAYEFDFWVEVE